MERIAATALPGIPYLNHIWTSNAIFTKSPASLPIDHEAKLLSFFFFFPFLCVCIYVFFSCEIISIPVSQESNGKIKEHDCHKSR